jgi:hypothetical protein
MKGIKMQYAYAVYGTRLHLVLEEEFANAYNRAQQKFFDAQRNHKERTGHQWEPDESLSIDWSEEEKKAFNGFAAFMNSYVEFVGAGLQLNNDPEAEFFPSDFLVKVEDQ